MEESIGLGRATKIAIAVLVVALIGTVGYVVWDMSRGPEATVLDYESERYEEFVADNPTSASAWLELANISLQQRKYEKAIAEYEESLSLNAAQPAALMGIGLAYMKIGDTDQAVSYLNQAVALAEDEEILQTGASLGTLHYYLGKIYLEAGEIELAADEADMALWYNRINADAIYLQGLVYEAQGDPAAAEENYLRALSLVPNFTEVYSQLGGLYESRGDGSMATYYEAMAALFSGEHDHAVERINSVIGSLPDNADAYWGLGWGYEKLNMMPEAIAAYEQAIGIDPNHRLAGGALTRLGAGIYVE
jgi:tetratricopeptide (TPR) repeat protein